MGPLRCISVCAFQIHSFRNDLTCLPLVTVFQHNYTICLVDLKKSQTTYLPVQFVWLMQVYLWISHEMHKKNTIFEVTAHIGHRKKTKKPPTTPGDKCMFSLKVGPQFVFLFAGDCTVAFTASSRRPFPICVPCVFFFSLPLCRDRRGVSCCLNWETSQVTRRVGLRYSY